MDSNFSRINSFFNKLLREKARTLTLASLTLDKIDFALSLIIEIID